MTTMTERRSGASRHLRTVFEAGALGVLGDSALLERFLAGRGDEDSAAAFAALAERHGPMVLSVCRAAMGDPHDAEDAAQATFLILARRAGSIRRAESLASWLFGVALRVSSKARAQQARRRALERLGAEMRVQAADSDRSLEASAEVHEELDRVPERFRSPIVLCHLEGLTNEQAATRLGVPVRTVQRRLTEGRERLRSRLTRRGLAPASRAILPVLGSAAGEASGAWIEATARAAAGLAAGRSITAVASASVASLVKTGSATLLLGRLKMLATGLLLAGTLGGLAGVGWLLRAGQEDPPVPAVARIQADRPAAAPTLRDRMRIRGLVVDEGRQPVAGARVRAIQADRPETAITAADGTFEMPVDGPNWLEQTLIATSDDGARQGLCRFTPDSALDAPGRSAGIMLHPARDVTVTVANGRGAPVPEAAVFLLDYVYPAAEARTDARGVAVLRVPEGLKTLWIVALKPGVGFDYFENYETDTPTDASPPPRAARLVLTGVLPNARVRVIDSDGRPVQGVEMYPVTIEKRGKFRFANLATLPFDPRTDSDGIATFDWLPADLTACTLETGTGDYRPAAPCTLDPGHLGELLTVSVRRPTRVSGKVTYADGSPAPGVWVEATGSGGPGIAASWEGRGRARTDADGAYDLRLMPGQSFTIKVVDHEGAGPGRTIEVREGQPRTGLDLQLDGKPPARGLVPLPPTARP
jgi:RNA polymerase sigma factor (sigma-70 family)